MFAIEPAVRKQHALRQPPRLRAVWSSGKFVVTLRGSRFYNSLSITNNRTIPLCFVSLRRWKNVFGPIKTAPIARSREGTCMLWSLAGRVVSYFFFLAGAFLAGAFLTAFLVAFFIE